MTDVVDNSTTRCSAETTDPAIEATSLPGGPFRTVEKEPRPPSRFVSGVIDAGPVASIDYYPPFESDADHVELTIEILEEDIK